MSELCIDASVAVKLVLKGEPYRNKARRLFSLLQVKSLQKKQRNLAHGMELSRK
jgi:hypothetical protein